MNGLPHNRVYLLWNLTVEMSNRYLLIFFFHRHQGYVYTYRVSKTETGSWSAEVCTSPFSSENFYILFDVRIDLMKYIQIIHVSA